MNQLHVSGSWMTNMYDCMTNMSPPQPMKERRSKTSPGLNGKLSSSSCILGHLVGGGIFDFGTHVPKSARTAPCWVPELQYATSAGLIWCWRHRTRALRHISDANFVMFMPSETGKEDLSLPFSRMMNWQVQPFRAIGMPINRLENCLVTSSLLPETWMSHLPHVAFKSFKVIPSNCLGLTSAKLETLTTFNLAFFIDPHGHLTHLGVLTRDQTSWRCQTRCDGTWGRRYGRLSNWKSVATWNMTPFRSRSCKWLAGILAMHHAAKTATLPRREEGGAHWHSMIWHQTSCHCLAPSAWTETSWGQTWNPNSITSSTGRSLLILVVHALSIIWCSILLVESPAFVNLLETLAGVAVWATLLVSWSVNL